MSYLARRHRSRSLASGKRTAVLGTLGDAAPDASIDPVDPQTRAWQQGMLSKSTELTDWQARWVQKDEMQRWIQIVATLSIPLAGAIWKLILGRRD